MKRLLIAAVALVALVVISLMGVAGSYFIAEQNPLAPVAQFQGGYNFLAPYIDMTNLSIGGDVYVQADNLWVYPWDVAGGLNLNFSFCNDFARNVFEVDLSLDMALAPIAEFGRLDVVIAGYPASWAAIYVKIGLANGLTWPYDILIGVSIGDRPSEPFGRGVGL